LFAALAFIVGFASTWLLAPRVAMINESRGLVGLDMHKPWGVRVPEAGGVTLILGLLASSPLLLLEGVDAGRLAAFLGTVVFAGLVGLLDDLRRLGAKSKPLLTFMASTPIIALGAYDPHLMLPFIGVARLTLIYPLLIPFFIAVMSNAVNMADTHNGVMPSSALLVFIVLFFTGIYVHGCGYSGPEAYALPLLMAGLLAGYYRYNRYPARLFNGDSGSLLVGSALASAMIMGRMEIVGLVASLPYILNGYNILRSVGGLKERGEMGERPVYVEDGLIHANRSSKAPLTIVGLMASRRPVTECEVAASYILVFLYSCILAFLTLPLTY